MNKVGMKQHRNVYGTDIITDIISEAMGLAMKKTNFHQLDGKLCQRQGRG